MEIYSNLMQKYLIIKIPITIGERYISGLSPQNYTELIIRKSWLMIDGTYSINEDHHIMKSNMFISWLNSNLTSNTVYKIKIYKPKNTMLGRKLFTKYEIFFLKKKNQLAIVVYDRIEDWMAYSGFSDVLKELISNKLKGK